MKVKVTQSCPTLCNSMNYSLPGSSVLGLLQARILEWVAIPFSRGSSLPRDLPRVSWFAGRSFTVWATREAPSLFLPLLICFANSRISYKWTHTWDTLLLFFGMASFTQHNYFLFFIAEWHSIVWMNHNLFIQSPDSGYLVCFYFLPIMKKPFYECSCANVFWIYVFISLG